MRDFEVVPQALWEYSHYISQRLDPVCQSHEPPEPWAMSSEELSLLVYEEF